MKNWENLFAIHILERGLDYYEEGAVTQVTATKNGYRATVMGTEDYKVEIEMKKGEVRDMQCDCPYAEDGNYCKHMAAVLYEIENEEPEDIDETDTTSSDSEHNLPKVIGDIPEPEVRSLLLELAKEDVHLKNRILTQYAKTISTQQIRRLKKEVERIADRYADHYGFVDWKNCYGYVQEMTRFLYDNVSHLIKKKCFMQAFELVNEVFVTVGNQDMDDSDGESAELAEECYEYWQEILESCGQKEQEQMFEWFEANHSAGIVVDYMEEYIYNFLMNEFQGEAFLRKILEILKDELEEADTETGKSSWSVHNIYGFNITKQLEIMEKLHYPEAEIKAYQKENWAIASIRKMEVNACIRDGREKEAVEILLESKILDKDYPGLVAEYSKELVGLYQKLQMQKEYKKELFFYVFHGSHTNLDYVERLKSICTKEEWEQYREQLLNRDKRWSLRYQLMESEGLYGRLFEEISASGSIGSLDWYEKTLGKEMPEQVRDCYVNYVRNQAERVSDRSGYRSLMKYLKKIKKYPGGKDIAKEIADGWRVTYRRRPAMMDELKKAGF